MHRIDSDGAVASMYDEGDPGVPRLPTMFDADAMNALQEEIAGVCEDNAPLEKGTNTQLLTALRALFVRVTGAAAQTITGVKTWSGRQIVSLTDAAAAAVSITNAGANKALYLIGAGTSAATAVLDVANSSTGPAENLTSGSAVATSAMRNTSTGPALSLRSEDGHWPLFITPVDTTPTLNPAGGALSAADNGAVVFVAGAFNKLYVYSHPTWNACW